MLYTKTYTRENCLIAFQIWENQVILLSEKFGGKMVPTLFDSYGGVVDVYANEEGWNSFAEKIANRSKSDSNFVPEMMSWYGENLDKLEKIWKIGKVETKEELDDFVKLAALSWVGLAISYVLPDLDGVSQKDKDLGMSLRVRAADFLELTDHVIQSTLRSLYSNLDDYIKYITIEEVVSGLIPNEEELSERQKHYIFFDFKISTKINLDDFVKNNNIEIYKEDIPQEVSEIKGQTAMKGRVSGYVKVLHNKSEIKDLKDGEILVTAMTTPDYLPAMYKASAFITDEGGITCHAAIVAREIGKPCIIGTKFATQLLKDGDVVEVDADNGVVRILK